MCRTTAEADENAGAMLVFRRHWSVPILKYIAGHQSRAAVRWEVKNLEKFAGKSQSHPDHMTRDGLVVENQADGTVENVSSRGGGTGYSPDSEGQDRKMGTRRGT